MTSSKLTKVCALLLATGLLATTAGVLAKADSPKDVQKTIIKIEAEQGDDIRVVAGEHNAMKKYEFSFEELANIDNISAQLDDLEPEVKEKVLSLLQQIQSNDAKIIEFKDVDMVIDGDATTVFMQKFGNGEDKMHIEVDVEGAGANSEKRFMVKRLLAGGKGHDKALRHHIKKEKRDPVKVIKKIIERSDLTPEQIAEIKTVLEQG